MPTRGDDGTIMAVDLSMVLLGFMWDSTVSFTFSLLFHFYFSIWTQKNTRLIFYLKKKILYTITYFYIF